ncbi:hypothetical protein [Methanoregula sp.]|jgi:hypothetical protein|uniref:hypothetical protein n=1 Tax=Methanoregula sp. TaxID=2052170 RepID=UPI003568B7C5
MNYSSFVSGPDRDEHIEGSKPRVPDKSQSGEANASMASQAGSPSCDAYSQNRGSRYFYLKKGMKHPLSDNVMTMSFE